MSAYQFVNFTIGKRRTGMRLEPELWTMLAEICAREGEDINTLVCKILATGNNTSQTSAVRVYIAHYFYAAVVAAGPAASEDGRSCEKLPSVSIDDSSGLECHHHRSAKACQISSKQPESSAAVAQERSDQVGPRLRWKARKDETNKANMPGSFDGLAESARPVTTYATREINNVGWVFRSGTEANALVDPAASQTLTARAVRSHHRDGQQTIRLGGLTVSLEPHLVSFGDIQLHLPAKEHAILKLLVLHAGRTVTKARILECLYGASNSVEPKIVDYFICSLRRRLTYVGVADPIVTVWGRGYKIQDGERVGA